MCRALGGASHADLALSPWRCSCPLPWLPRSARRTPTWTRRAPLTTLAKKIWDTPETALNEKKSAQALVDALQKEGFKVACGRRWSADGVVGFRAPVSDPRVASRVRTRSGLSQKAGSTSKSALVEAGPGHALRRDLLGTAATAAAIAANRERQSESCPAPSVFGLRRRGPLRKAFMIRDSAFKGTDMVLAWHRTIRTAW